MICVILYKKYIHDFLFWDWILVIFLFYLLFYILKFFLCPFSKPFPIALSALLQILGLFFKKSVVIECIYMFV